MCSEKVVQMVVNSSKFNFAGEVRAFMRQYEAGITEELTQAISEVSKEAVNKLKQESAAQFGAGKYSKGWRRKMETGRMRVGATVYGAKPTYAMAHLLENGHVSRNGTGRTFDPVPAYVHIAPVEKWATEEAYDRAMRYLENRV